MTRRIVALFPDGSELVLAKPPTWAEMQKIVGGPVERVTVLDHLEGERGVYTSMFVHESGLLDGLPRNPKATEAYQRNARRFFPQAENPFRAIDEAWRARLPNPFRAVDMTPEHAIAAGYKDDPWIAGPAILFEGWTCQEVDAAL
jgi:hypothetical protein